MRDEVPSGFGSFDRFGWLEEEGIGGRCLDQVAKWTS